MKKIILLSLFAALCGCASTSAPVVNSVNFSDPDDISAHIDIKYDNFTKVTSFGGPKITSSEIITHDGAERTGPVVVTLNASSAGAVAQYYIVVTVPYYDADWRYYSDIYGYDNVHFKPSVDRQVVSCHSKCTYMENANFVVTRGYLEKHTGVNGALFRIKGNGRDFDFWLPGQYIVGLLKTVDANAKAQ